MKKSERILPLKKLKLPNILPGNIVGVYSREE